MKKELLILALALLLVGSPALAETSKDTTNLNQKACNNIFSLVNVSVSAFSPSVSAADISVKGNKIAPPPVKGDVPVADKTPRQEPVEAIQPARELNNVSIKTPDKTSFFRIDLLGIIKIKLF